MNNLLKKKEYYLRPYNMYVAVFEQNNISVPTLIKVLYNDFKLFITGFFSGIFTEYLLKF